MEDKIERHVLSDPTVWANLLGYFRLGYGPHQAAGAVGVTKRALDSFLRNDPFKLEQVEDAVAYWRETVESKLHDAVAEGEPWAITMTLKAEMPERYGQKVATQTQVVVASAADLARLIELAEQRPLVSGSVDVAEPADLVDEGE